MVKFNDKIEIDFIKFLCWCNIVYNLMRVLNFINVNCWCGSLGWKLFCVWKLIIKIKLFFVN